MRNRTLVPVEAGFGEPLVSEQDSEDRNRQADEEPDELGCPAAAGVLGAVCSQRGLLLRCVPAYVHAVSNRGPWAQGRAGVPRSVPDNELGQPWRPRCFQDPDVAGQLGGTGTDLVHLYVVAMAIAAAGVIAEQQPGMLIAEDPG